MSLGIIVFTHSTLAQGFVAAAEMIFGEKKDVAALSFLDGDNLIEKSELVKKTIKDMGCDRTVVLTDLYGASPNNASSLAIVEVGGVVVSGLNMTMLIEAIGMQDDETPLEQMADKLMEIGKTGIRKITKEIIEATGQRMSKGVKI